MIKTIVLSSTSEHIHFLAQEIRAGAVVGIPTETVYGLAGNALDSRAIDRIFTAKGRPSDNPLIVHVASMAMLKQVVSDLPPVAQTLAAAFWPGALTMILPKADNLPLCVTAGLATVGVRMPAHPVALALIESCGVPLAAPSANRSGYPSPTTSAHVLQDLEGKISYILAGGDCVVGVESTVIRIVGEQIELLRPGGVTLEQLRKFVPQITMHAGVWQTPTPGERVPSPGMKYRHYAPKATMTMIQGGIIDFYDTVCSQKADGTGVLVFDGEERLFELPCFTYGAVTDMVAQATRLFDALRQIDCKGKENDLAPCKHIFVRPPAQTGMGLAVYNRLLRACSFMVEDATQMQVIGLTGQTGAGKSTVRTYLAQKCLSQGQRLEVIDCDQLAHDLLDTPTIKKDVVKLFGIAILQKNDSTMSAQINSKALGRVVFGDATKLAQLTALLYPAIKRTIKRTLLAGRAQGNTLMIVDAPTLFESGADVFCDLVIAVTASADLRKSRIIQRDGLTEELAQQRMGAQQPDAFYTTHAQYVLQNHQDIALLRQKMDQVIEQVFRTNSN